jgi:hypothetical protein
LTISPWTGQLLRPGQGCEPPFARYSLGLFLQEEQLDVETNLIRERFFGPLDVAVVLDAETDMLATNSSNL